MKDFIYASADDAALTDSLVAQERLNLVIPGDPRNPQTWLVFTTWQACWSTGQTEAEYLAEYERLDSPAGTVEIAAHCWSPDDADQVESLGGFHLFRDLADDVRIKISWRNVTSGSPALAEIRNARILALRIPEHAIPAVLEDHAGTGGALAVAGTLEGWAGARGRVPAGRYLAVGSVDVTLGGASPAGSGTVSAVLRIARGAEVLGTPVTAQDEVVADVPPTMFDSTAHSPAVELHLARSWAQDGSERRHTFVFLGVVDLEDEPVSLVVATESDSGDAQALGLVNHARVALIPLDPVWQYRHLAQPGVLHSSATTETPILTGSGRTDVGVERNAIRLVYAALGHDASSPLAGLEVTATDLSASPDVSLGSALLPSDLLGPTVQEFLVATVTAADGPVELSYLEQGGTGAGQVGAGLLLSIVDPQSNQDLEVRHQGLEYGWDLAGAKLDDPVDIFAILKLRRLAQMGRPVVTLTDVELATEQIDTTQVAMSDRLLRSTGTVVAVVDDAALGGEDEYDTARFMVMA